MIGHILSEVENKSGQSWHHPINHDRLMASNLALSTYELTQNISNSKFQSDQGRIDDLLMTRQPKLHSIMSLLWPSALSLQRESSSCSPQSSKLCAERLQGPGVRELGCFL